MRRAYFANAVFNCINILKPSRLSLAMQSTVAFEVCHPIHLLSAEKAYALDQDLMTTPGFSLDQLMELAGLSVACSIEKIYPRCPILVVCGPGNNGGDGLVAARHLFHFGFKPQVYYPKRTAKEIYTNLVFQLEQLGIVLMNDMPTADQISSEFNIILDCIFGFSFRGPVRSPFDHAISTIKMSNVPIVSVDVPSGWNVDECCNDPSLKIEPEMLISLSAPKLCARKFSGKYHFLGGRFLPPCLSDKYELSWLPAFNGSDQCVQLLEWGQEL